MLSVEHNYQVWSPSPVYYHTTRHRTWAIGHKVLFTATLSSRPSLLLVCTRGGREGKVGGNWTNMKFQCLSPGCQSLCHTIISSQPTVAALAASVNIFELGIFVSGCPQSTAYPHLTQAISKIVKGKAVSPGIVTKIMKMACDQTWYEIPVSECYQSLMAHQHQKGHTVPKQVITIAMSIHVSTV